MGASEKAGGTTVVDSLARFGTDAVRIRCQIIVD